MTTTTTQTPAATEMTKEERNRRLAAAMLKLRTDRQIVTDYKKAARQFADNPQGPDSSALIITMGWMDAEMLNRPHIECCKDCSVPLAAKYHIRQLHNPDVAVVAEALTDAAMAAIERVRPLDGR